MAKAIQASLGNDEESQINAAILASIKNDSYEPLNPEQRKREVNCPVGLKNIGNTCYFNSILQVYFNMPDFVQAVFEFKDDGLVLTPYQSTESSAQDIE